jgi:hypothetical protein
MDVDWQAKAVRLQRECHGAGVVLVASAVAIAYLTDSWWGYGLAAYVGMSGMSALSAKI